MVKAYITKDAAIAAAIEAVDGWDGWTSKTRDQGITAAINSIPAADVVARDCYDMILEENDRLRKERPVVRCMDCKHYDCEDGDQKCVKDAEWDEETACYYGFVSYHGPKFFCADGERKDGGQDGV